MTVVLSQTDVRQLLPMEPCIQLMEEAFRALARGNAVNPLRKGMLLPEGLGLIGTMPGYISSPEALGIKVVTVFPGNHGTKFDSHQGIVMLFDPENGTPQAILDASEVTAIRTAAASAVATKLLARHDAVQLAIIGSGVQARTHLEAMLIARPVSTVKVFSPTAANRVEFARREGARHGIPIQAVDSAENAVRDADIICTTTSSREPVVRGAWLTPGSHVNAVGSSIPKARELDTDAVVRGKLFVDRRESTLNEAGDYLIPQREGAINESHLLAEIGELLTNEATGRASPDDITIFKSLGLAVEDVAAARYVYTQALAQGVGVEVALGGLR